MLMATAVRAGLSPVDAHANADGRFAALRQKLARQCPASPAR